MVFSKQQLYELTTKNGGLFEVQNSIEAFKFCEKLATSHYENFPVGSLLIPKHLRKYVFSVYAFSRIADDIADELTDVSLQDRIEKLNQYEQLLYDYDLLIKKKGNPIFVALHQTIKDLEIPIDLFTKLLIAFKRDINFKQSVNFSDLLDYCKYSANPVGELVLRIFGIKDKLIIEYSDNICSSLQLINFWQDLSIDIKNNRLYIPEKSLIDFSLSKNDIINIDNQERILSLLDELYERTSSLMNDGRKILKHLKPLRLKFEIALTIEGGTRILQKIKKYDIKILKSRPKLKIIDYIIILFRCFSSIIFSKRWK